MIFVTCASCQKSLKVPDEWGGKIGACPHCKGKMRIPMPDPHHAQSSAHPAQSAPNPGVAAPPPLPPQFSQQQPQHGSGQYPAPHQIAGQQVAAGQAPVPNQYPPPGQDQSGSYSQQPPSGRHRRPHPDDDRYDDDSGMDPRPRRRKKKKKKKKKDNDDFFFNTANDFYIALAVLAGIGVVLGGVSVFLPVVFFGTLFFCALVGVVNNYWFLAIVAEEGGPGWLMACRFLPFASLIFLINHFEQCKKTLFLGFVNTFILGVGGAGALIGMMIQNRP